jgi:hypothetical protein
VKDCRCEGRQVEFLKAPRSMRPAPCGVARTRTLLLLLTSVWLSTVLAGTADAESSDEMRRAYMRQELGVHGPLDCGITVVQFRVAAKHEIQQKITEQKREALFVTPDGKPYPFSQLYIEDLIGLRDLLRVDDVAHKDVWDERIRKAALVGYERIRSEKEER